MPGLADVTFEYKRPDRTNDRAATKPEQPSYAAQCGIAATGFSIEMVDDGGSHALFRSCQVFCQTDHFVSDEGIRRAGLHDDHPDNCRNETGIGTESKCDLQFV